MNILSAAERLAAIDRKAVTFNPDRCLYGFDKYSTCEHCFTICPVEAIKSGKPPSLNEEACQTCLACIPVCPVNAYSAEDAVPALLNCAVRVEARSIELVCETHPTAEQGLSEADTVIRVRGCLAGLGVGAYLTLIALGLERVTSRLDACDQCPWGSLKLHITNQVRAAQRLLKPWGLEKTLAQVSSPEKSELPILPVWDADNVPLSRRDLFRMASQRGQIVAARAMTSLEGEATDRRPSKDRLRSLRALERLPAIETGKFDLLSLQGLGFASISISSDCTASATCARVCPTGAIRFEREQFSFELTFSADQCIGCEVCLHVCVPQAISIDHRPSFVSLYAADEPITLFAGELVRCERCNVLMAAKPDTKFCPLCDFRQKNPFSSVLPPGFAAGQRPQDTREMDS